MSATEHTWPTSGDINTYMYHVRGNQEGHTQDTCAPIGTTLADQLARMVTCKLRTYALLLLAFCFVLCQAKVQWDPDVKMVADGSSSPWRETGLGFPDRASDRVVPFLDKAEWHPDMKMVGDGSNSPWGEEALGFSDIASDRVVPFLDKLKMDVIADCLKRCSEHSSLDSLECDSICKSLVNVQHSSNNILARHLHVNTLGDGRSSTDDTKILSDKTVDRVVRLLDELFLKEVEHCTHRCVQMRGFHPFVCDSLCTSLINRLPLLARDLYVNTLGDGRSSTDDTKILSDKTVDRVVRGLDRVFLETVEFCRDKCVQKTGFEPFKCDSLCTSLINRLPLMTRDMYVNTLGDGRSSTDNTELLSDKTVDRVLRLLDKVAEIFEEDRT